MHCRVSTYAPIIPRRQEPLVMVDDGADLHIFKISDFKPRPPKPFPLDVQDELEPPTTSEPERRSESRVSSNDRELAGATERLDLQEGEGSDDEDEFPDGPPETYKREQLPAALLDSVPHWTIPKGTQGVMRATETSDKPDLHRCQMVINGQMIVGVSENGTMLLWRLNAP